MLEETVLERSLPQNLEAERSVLGSVLLDEASLTTVVPMLQPDDFYSDGHRRIYYAMRTIFDRSGRIDIVTLSEELEHQEALDKVGGTAYLASLMDSAPDVANVEHYARIVKEKATARRIISVGQRAMRDGLSQERPVADLLNAVAGEIFDIAQEAIPGGFRPLSEAVTHTIEVMEQSQRQQGMLSGLPTGFEKLNHLTSGFNRSDLIIIAARPSVGKTAFSLNIAQHMALRSGKSVGFFSLEMAAEQLAFRVLCSEAQVDAKKVRDGFASKQDITQLALARAKIGSGRFFIDDTAALSVPEMRAKLQRLRRENGLDIAFVDYLQLMQGHGRFDNRVQEVSQISRGLKLLAKEMDIPVVALSQLSRNPEQRREGKGRPQLSDLRESGSIEQDADVVIFLYREEMYNRETENKGLADALIAKQRNGPTGDFKLVFRQEFMTFADYAGPVEEPF
jgi:replicative DNA helicase